MTLTIKIQNLSVKENKWFPTRTFQSRNDEYVERILMAKNSESYDLWQNSEDRKNTRPKRYQKSDVEVLLFNENYHEYDMSKKCPNNFLGAFYEAYMIHGDVQINPDDLWIQIMLFLSEYVNDRSELLRSKFVRHEGKMKLTVTEIAK